MEISENAKWKIREIIGLGISASFAILITVFFIHSEIKENMLILKETSKIIKEANDNLANVQSELKATSDTLLKVQSQLEEPRQRK